MANGDLELVVWDVAHGVSIFANTPNGRCIMLDAGASDDFSPVAWLKDKFHLNRLDGIIISHPHADHVREIAKVWSELNPTICLRNKTIPRDVLYPENDPPPVDPLKTYDAFDKHYQHPADEQDRFNIPANWGNTSIRTFWHDGSKHAFTNVNDYSVVTVIDYGILKFVFPGDLEAPGWEPMMARQDFVQACTSTVPQIRVLVASHHGHARGLYKPFLEMYQPHLTLISAVHGDEHTEADAYRAASSGCYVQSSQNNQSTLCKVVTTKVNDYIFLRVDGQANSLVVIV